jgi:lysophospholipase L1-like esterase
MKNAWAWLGVVALLFVATGRGLGAAMAGSAPRARPSSILIIGDSHSQGSWTLGGVLSSAFEEAGIPTVQMAVSGSSVWWWLQESRLRDHLAGLSHVPSLVIVELGGGDASRRVTREKHRAALYQFVEILRSAGAQEIIWLSPTKDDIAGGNDLVRQELATWQAEELPALGVEVIAMRPYTEAIPTTDGIHYDRDGYSAWGNAVLAGPLNWLVS